MPLALKHDPKNVYSVNLQALPETAGIYLILRVHGPNAECLYVGKAGNLRSRVKGQLNNSKLMQGVKNAVGSQRKIVVGEFKARPGQQQTKCLLSIERTLIRHYLSLGDQLINIQGTKLVKHSVTSVRPALKKFIPAEIYFEK